MISCYRYLSFIFPAYNAHSWLCTSRYFCFLPQYGKPPVSILSPKWTEKLYQMGEGEGGGLAHPFEFYILASMASYCGAPSLSTQIRLIHSHCSSLCSDWRRALWFSLSLELCSSAGCRRLCATFS